jgi:hypothetical protein
MVAMPVNALYPLYGLLVFGSLMLFFYLIFHVDKVSIKQRLHNRVYKKLSGGVLVGFGIAFLLRALNLLANPIFRNISLPVTDLSVLIADIVLSTAWIISGILLWQNKALGFATGGALLFQGAMLFLGLILFLLINPLLTKVPFDLAGIVIILVMTIVCNIPFGLFVRGVVNIPGVRLTETGSNNYKG